jgi:tricorn protease-like protein
MNFRQSSLSGRNSGRAESTALNHERESQAWGCPRPEMTMDKAREILGVRVWWSPDSRFVAYVNGAYFFERTPAQQLREMVRLRVRRLDDGSENSFADFFDGDTMEFQWVKIRKIKSPAP